MFLGANCRCELSVILFAVVHTKKNIKKNLYLIKISIFAHEAWKLLKNLFIKSQSFRFPRTCLY